VWGKDEEEIEMKITEEGCSQQVQNPNARLKTEKGRQNGGLL